MQNRNKLITPSAFYGAYIIFIQTFYLIRQVFHAENTWFHQKKLLPLHERKHEPGIPRVKWRGRKSFQPADSDNGPHKCSSGKDGVQVPKWLVGLRQGPAQMHCPHSEPQEVCQKGGGVPGGPETRLALSRTLLSSLALLLEALYFLCVHVHVCIYVHERAVACGGQRSILSFPQMLPTLFPLNSHSLVEASHTG